MKIIVMNSADLRLEVLEVADNLLAEGIEQFLVAHDYSLNYISWMAAPIDCVPVQFHDYGINGEETHSMRRTRLKDFFHLRERERGEAPRAKGTGQNTLQVWQKS